MKADEDRVSDWLLERHALGELSGEEDARLRDRAAADPLLAGRMEALRRSDAEILDAYPVSEMASRITERIGAHAAGGGEGRAGGKKAPATVAIRRSPQKILAMVAAAAAIFAIAGGGLLARFDGGDGIRLKGDHPGLLVFMKTSGGAERIADGAAAAKGDLLQLGYDVGKKAYGAIFSVDGRGNVTFHLPAGYAGGPARAPSLGEGGATLLASAYELDDAPVFERFVFVYSSDPFDLGAVAKAAAALAADPAAGARIDPQLPRSLRWQSLLVRKDGAR